MFFERQLGLWRIWVLSFLCIGEDIWYYPFFVRNFIWTLTRLNLWVAKCIRLGSVEHRFVWSKAGVDCWGKSCVLPAKPKNIPHLYTLVICCCWNPSMLHTVGPGVIIIVTMDSEPGTSVQEILGSSQDTTSISLLSAMRHADPLPRWWRCKTVGPRYKICQDPGHPCYAGARRAIAQSWVKMVNCQLLVVFFHGKRRWKNMEFTIEKWTWNPKNWWFGSMCFLFPRGHVQVQC